MAVRVIAALVCMLALAVPAGASDMETAAARLLSAGAAEVNGWNAADVRVDGLFLSPAASALPDGAELVPVGRLAPGPGRRSLLFRVVKDGKTVATLRAVAQIHLLAPVVTLARFLPRHHVVESGDLVVRRMDLSAAGEGVFARVADVRGKRLRRSLAAGAVLRAADLESVPLVRRGDVVEIVARLGNIEVRAPGLAREDGRAGDTVRVKNMASRRLILARVAGRGTVVPFLR